MQKQFHSFPAGSSAPPPYSTATAGEPGGQTTYGGQTQTYGGQTYSAHSAAPRPAGTYTTGPYQHSAAQATYASASADGHPMYHGGTSYYAAASQGRVPASAAAPAAPPVMLEWRRIMLETFCSFTDDCCFCFRAFLGLRGLFGETYAKSGQGNCLFGCCFRWCLCATSRQHIQGLLGVRKDSWCSACCLHTCCPICAVTQEARAMKAWIAGGRPLTTDAVPGPVVMNSARSASGSSLPRGPASGGSAPRGAASGGASSGHALQRSSGY